MLGLSKRGSILGMISAWAKVLRVYELGRRRRTVTPSILYPSKLMLICLVALISMGLLLSQNTAAQGDPPCGIVTPDCNVTVYGPYSDGNCVGIVMDFACGDVTWCGIPIPGSSSSGTCAASTCGSGGVIVVTCSQ